MPYLAAVITRMVRCAPEGTDALLKALDRGLVSEVFDPARPSSV
ncbi:hypothetical protein [Micromonospora echinaurantiaca]|nr:hypothetical protein [Micromonospora echinaurantiaca]